MNEPFENYAAHVRRFLVKMNVPPHALTRLEIYAAWEEGINAYDCAHNFSAYLVDLENAGQVALSH